jgi:hypothetical protein
MKVVHSCIRKRIGFSNVASMSRLFDDPGVLQELSCTGPCFVVQLKGAMQEILGVLRYV